MAPLRPSPLALLALSAAVSPVKPFLVSSTSGAALHTAHGWARGAGATAGASPTAARRSAGLTVRFGLEEGAVMFTGEEVPTHGMQQWVAWCELGDPSSPGYEKRSAKRRELQETHCVWERTSMLPYQKDQLRSAFGTVDEETEVPDEQRTRARVLWDKSLYSDADKYVIDGMVLCGAAKDRADFDELLAKDPYTEAGIWHTTEVYKWNQAREKELMWGAGPLPHVLLCKDKPGALETRKKTRAKHLNWLRDSGKVFAAGPLIPSDGETPVGSLVCVQGDNVKGTAEWAENDPYAQAGVFESVHCRQYADVDVTGLYVLTDSMAGDTDLVAETADYLYRKEKAEAEGEGWTDVEDEDDEEDDWEGDVDEEEEVGLDDALDDLDAMAAIEELEGMEAI